MATFSARAAWMAGSALAVLWAIGCGGSSASGAAGASAALRARASGTAPHAANDKTADDRAEYDDPEEAGDPATLTPVFAKGERLPPATKTVSEGECWQSVSLTGEARHDYASLVERCGKPTGAVEYAKPAVGKLDFVQDRRDTFNVFLQGGRCYRFFGVGDATIASLDILIERNGALQAEDLTQGPVAIINTDRAWCLDSDAEYRFLLQLRSAGRGRYVFGVWARAPT